MTIEIKQLIIRAVVDGRQQLTPEPAEPVALAPTAPNRSNGEQTLSTHERAAIVATCVREVLRKLERAHQR